MKKSQLDKLIREEISRVNELGNDPTTTLMIGLSRLVDDMKSKLETINHELRTDPELTYKAREVEMVIKSLNHKLDVLKEKFEI